VKSPYDLAWLPDYLGSYFDKPARKLLIGVALQTVACAAAIGVTEATGGDTAGRPLLIAGILLASWFGGMLGGLAATVIALLALSYYFYLPRGSFSLYSANDVANFLSFYFIAVLINAMNLWRRRGEQDLLRTKDDLASLQKATAYLVKTTTTEDAADRAVQAGLKSLGAAAGFVTRYLPDTDEFEMLGISGYAGFGASRQVYPGGVATPMAEAFRTQRTVIYRSLAEIRERYPQRGRINLGTAPQSTLDIPLFTSRGRYGVFSLTFAEERLFPPAEVMLIEAFAALCGQSLERAELFDEARQAAEQLRVANVAKDEFVGLVTHELRSPLSTLMGDSALLKSRRRQLDEADVAELIDDMHSAAQRMAETIDNMLTIARLDAGLRPECAPLPVGEICQNVVSRTMARSGIEIRPPADHEDLLVIGNGPYLEQVLENFLTNACKYGQPPVDLAVEVSDREVCISVRDSGPGLDPTEIPNLFEMFYRSARAGETASGFGVGLTVAARLAGAMDGRVWAANRSSGGAEFGIALPSVVRQESPRKDLALKA